MATTTNSTTIKLGLRHIAAITNQPKLLARPNHRYKGKKLKLANSTPTINSAVEPHSIKNSKVRFFKNSFCMKPYSFFYFYKQLQQHRQYDNSKKQHRLLRTNIQR